MMITQNHFYLLISCSSLLFIVQISDATSSCNPSSCGIILNISSPFRLKGDPKHCGDNKYELVCENNVASLYLDSRRYPVKAINYHNFTIRLTDEISLNMISPSSICSLSMSSAFQYSHPFRYSDPFFLEVNYENQPITFLSCQYPLHNLSLLAPVIDCDKALNSSHGSHTYIKVGHIQVKDVESMCTEEASLPTSWNFTDMNNVSLSLLHQSLLYGFELDWMSFLCGKCKGSGCSVSDGVPSCSMHHTGLYYHWGPKAGRLMILLLFVAILFAGVSIPVKITIGLGTSYWIFVRDWHLETIQRILVISFRVRFIVGIVCGMCFLIYKFRRRHLSVYSVIEDFLQSDNQLTPIRYSYSDLKKMTRGFREKLGEGGFGSVYKGKLRSKSPRKA